MNASSWFIVLSAIVAFVLCAWVFAQPEHTDTTTQPGRRTLLTEEDIINSPQGSRGNPAGEKQRTCARKEDTKL